MSVDTEFPRVDQGTKRQSNIYDLLDYLETLVRIARRYPTPTVIASIQRTTDKIVERLG